MVRDPLEGTLQEMVQLGAIAVGGAALAVLGLAVIGECLDHRRRAPRARALIGRLVPARARWTAAALLTLLPALLPRPAAADDSIRDWLQAGQPVATTSTLATPGPLPDPVAPADPVQIELPPPLVIVAPTAITDAPGPLPQTPASPEVPGAPTNPIAGSEEYLVRRGDCLWAIAAARLGPGAPASAIDAGWRRIYAANRSVIGDDPDLVLAGTVLQLPPIQPSP